MVDGINDAVVSDCCRNISAGDEAFNFVRSGIPPDLDAIPVIGLTSLAW